MTREQRAYKGIVRRRRIRKAKRYIGRVLELAWFTFCCVSLPMVLVFWLCFIG